MKPRVIVTGASGFIGRSLCAHLLRGDYEVIALSRGTVPRTTGTESLRWVRWDASTTEGWLPLLEGAAAVINLAGENISTGYWTREKKKRIMESRLQAGTAVLEAVSRVRKKPEVVLQSSAIGFYGSRGDAILREDSPPGRGVLAEVAGRAEQILRPVVQEGVRYAVLRTSLVLGEEGGFLSPFIAPFRYFAGGYPGNGLQWLSWIHIYDELRAIAFLLEKRKLEGVFNLCAPEPVRARDFFRTLGRVMKRPAWVPLPGWAIKLFLREMGRELVLSSQRVMPSRLEEAGFRFKYRELNPALRSLL